MPAKRNPVHINAVGSLYLLGTHASQMSRDAFIKPLTEEQHRELVKLSIVALKASGVPQAEVLNEISSVFGSIANGTSLKPAPASIPDVRDAIPMKEDEKERLVPAATPEKKGGLFR